MTAIPQDSAFPSPASEETFAFEEMISDVGEYAIFTLSLSGHIQNWNRGAELIKGYTADEIVGRHFSDFYSAADREARLPDRELEIVTTEGSFADEGWRLRKDGTRFWASVTITALRRQKDGEVTGFLKITRDLTDRMLSSEALRQSEERFRLLLESVHDYAIFMLDPEGHVMSWNSGARRLKGYQEAEILGSHFSIFYPAEARASHFPEALLRRALTEGRVEVEGWRVRKDGSRFWGNVLITPLYDHHGEMHGFAKVTRDLTDRRESEKLQETGRRKDVFLATLGHELRNPLAPLLPGVELLKRSANNSATVFDLAGMFERQIGQMARLIDDLLDMSRISSGKIALRRSHVPLQGVIDSAIESAMPQIRQAEHELILDLPKEMVTIDADPHRISQIITNLLTNAARYTPDKGRITLSASIDPAAVLRLSVADNGRGIPKAWHQKIFELFEQTNGEAGQGLGIGLTLVKNLVELHSGTVNVLSEGEGRGAEFIVLLPVLTANPRADSAVQAFSPAETRPRKVLVADDSHSAADVMTMFFQLEGMEVATAYDGQEAVDKALTFCPDTVFLDLGMPRLDGFEAARRILQLHPATRLIALSGWGREEDKRRSAEAGFCLHLVKPVSPADLRQVISQLDGGDSAALETMITPA